MQQCGGLHERLGSLMYSMISKTMFVIVWLSSISRLGPAVQQRPGPPAA